MEKLHLTDRLEWYAFTGRYPGTDLLGKADDSEVLDIMVHLEALDL